MVMTTNRGRRFWRRDETLAFHGHALAHDDVAELLAEEFVLAISSAEESNEGVRDPVLQRRRARSFRRE